MTIDPEELGRRASAALGVHVNRVSPMTGGRSSLTFLAKAGAVERVVIKVAPPGLAPLLNRDVLRQARLLDALALVRGVLVPKVLGMDEGRPPDIPPFFVMEFIEGECFEPILDEADHLPSAPDIAGRARSAAAMLARLHAVSPASLGIDDQAAGLDAEVTRWQRVLVSADKQMTSTAARLASWLTSSQPLSAPPVILHGDYRLGNMLCGNGVVRAIIDWEIWSIGDPRLDIAWFVMTAHPNRYPGATRVCPGMPPPDDLLAHYGAVVPDLRWFEALSCFKKAAAIALIVKHNVRHGVPSELRLTASIPALLERVTSLIRGPA